MLPSRMLLSHMLFWLLGSSVAPSGEFHTVLRSVGIIQKSRNSDRTIDSVVAFASRQGQLDR